MQITNPPQQVPYLTTVDGQKLQCKILEIGDWDMNVTPFVQIAHGLGSDWLKIRFIQCIIRHDTDAQYLMMDSGWDAADPSLCNGFVASITSTIITLVRRTGGAFDDVIFDLTPYQRGWIVVWYVA